MFWDSSSDKIEQNYQWRAEMNLKAAIDYFNAHEQTTLNELMEFLSIPSVSTDPERLDKVESAARFIAEKLRSIGMENIHIFPTQRHPIVYADYLHAGAQQPTVLVYGHYDVQPEDHIELWHSDPFSPVILGDHLVARGASDMKGQIFAIVAALEAIKNTGEIPINVKFILEGEEEIGSPNLVPFLEEHKEFLHAR